MPPSLGNSCSNTVLISSSLGAELHSAGKFEGHTFLSHTEVALVVVIVVVFGIIFKSALKEHKKKKESSRTVCLPTSAASRSPWAMDLLRGQIYERNAGVAGVIPVYFIALY